MNSTDCVLAFIRAFDALNIDYMLVGSYSSNQYGRPRSTKDADFVVQSTSENLDKLRKLVTDEFLFDPQMTWESITLTTRYVIRHRNSEFKIEIFLLSDEAHDKSRFARRRAIEFEGQRVVFPTPEDVIITKLRWSKHGKRAKDIDDVRQVLALQHQRLDLDYLRNWCDQHGTRDLFEPLLSEAQARGF